MKIFEKEYSYEVLCDLGEDIYEAFDVESNTTLKPVFENKKVLASGSFKVTIEWVSNDQ